MRGIVTAGRRACLAAALAVCCAATTGLGAPLSAAATMTGPCTASGLTATSGVDVTTESVWHVRSSDLIVGEGVAGSPQKHVKLVVKSFGIGLAAVIDRTGAGSDSGGAGPYKVSDYSRYARVFSISGSSDGCTADLTVIVDDISAVTTVVGAVSLALAVLGFIGLLLSARLRGRVGGRIIGMVAGFFGGVGLAEFLQQTGFLSPSSSRDLAIPIAGILAGLLVAGSLAPGPPRAPVPTVSPSVPPAT